MRFKTPMLRSDLCDYSDACIFLKEEMDVKAGINQKDAVLKNNAPFVSCMKISTTH